MTTTVGAINDATYIVLTRTGLGEEVILLIWSNAWWTRLRCYSNNESCCHTSGFNNPAGTIELTATQKLMLFHTWVRCTHWNTTTQVSVHFKDGGSGRDGENNLKLRQWNSPLVEQCAPAACQCFFRWRSLGHWSSDNGCGFGDSVQVPDKCVPYPQNNAPSSSQPSPSPSAAPPPSLLPPGCRMQVQERSSVMCKQGCVCHGRHPKFLCFLVADGLCLLAGRGGDWR